MKRREYFLYAKKIKIITFFQQFVSSVLRFLRVFTLWFEWKQRILVLRLTQKSARSLRPADILQNGATVTRRDTEETNCWKNVFFIFFAYKKYSCRFIKFRLNHWWQMDYSDDASHTFLGLDSENYLAVNGTVTSLPGFIQKILNCAFTGLERHGGD